MLLLDLVVADLALDGESTAPDEQRRPGFQAHGRVAPGVADPNRVIELEATHGQHLFGFVRRLGLTDQQAADCVQEVLLRLWTTLDRGVVVLDPKAWAFRSIYRLAMDEYRLRRRVASLVGTLGRRAAGAAPGVDHDDRIAVWAEVDRLPARQRQVVYLRYRVDLTYDEIGEVLHITASGARSHATQAMAALRRRLGEGRPHEEAR